MTPDAADPLAQSWIDAGTQVLEDARAACGELWAVLDDLDRLVQARIGREGEPDGR